MFSKEMMDEWDRKDAERKKAELIVTRPDWRDATIDETGSGDRFPARVQNFRDSGRSVVTHHFWWLVHNCVTHPLIGVMPIKPFFDFHDYTSRKINGTDVQMVECVRTISFPNMGPSFIVGKKYKVGTREGEYVKVQNERDVWIEFKDTHLVPARNHHSRGMYEFGDYFKKT